MVYPISKTLLEKHFSKDVVDIYTELSRKNLYTNPNLVFHPSLRKYQNEGIQRIILHNSFGIFDQQRLGKTPTILISIQQKQIKNSVFIVAPKSTLVNWEQECNTWINEVSVCRIDSSKYNKQKRKSLYKENKKIYIMTYNTLSNDMDILPTVECLIIDEAHRLRNFKGLRSKSSPKFTKDIVQLSYKCKYKYLLTGTPSPNYPYNIYPILHIMHPKLFTSYYKFIDYYFEQKEVYIGRNKTIIEPCGFKKGKDKELQELLNMTSIQRKRKDYMDWLPKIDKKFIKIEMDTQEMLWYNELVTTFEIKDLNIICQNQLTLLIAARQFTSKIKLKWVLDYINDYENEQIIIVSMFTSILNLLKEKIPKAKMCIGSTSDKNRKKLQDDFNNKKYNILLANIDVIKEGMKFEQCNTMIVIDPTLVYTDNEQLEDRIIPTNKEVAAEKEKQQVINLIIKDSVDEYIYKQLKLKKSSTEIINNFNKGYKKEV